LLAQQNEDVETAKQDLIDYLAEHQIEAVFDAEGNIV
jgi:hypothetical protein